MRFTEEMTERAHYDVLVAGGGLAGVAAAVAAARAGKRVLLLEKSQKLGGLATLGLINLFVPMCNGRGKQIIFGMAEEFLRLSIRNGYGGVPEDFVSGRIPEEKLAFYRAEGKLPPRYMTRFSPEIFALELTGLCAEVGVDLRFDALLTRAAVEETGGRKRILGVVIEEKSGPAYYGADMFVDATGDGDLMARAGLPTAVRGNFHTYMGLRITLDALKKLKDAGHAFRMVFVGSGGDHDEVVAYAESLGLSDCVFFTSPKYDRNVIRDWYCRADLFLFPSTFDTNGLVVREAAACELASVLVRGSCAAEDITDGENGFLIEENAESMAKLLAKLCHEPERLKRVGRQAQDEIYLSWDDAVHRAQQRYEAVIEAYRSGHSEPRRSLAEEYYETLAACAAALKRSRAHLRDHWDTFAEHFQ